MPLLLVKRCSVLWNITSINHRVALALVRYQARVPKVATNTTKPVVLRIGLRKRPVGRAMNVLFTKHRSIIAPTARGNYPVHLNSATFGILFFSGALN